jgi:hypothetical protein
MSARTETGWSRRLWGSKRPLTILALLLVLGILALVGYLASRSHNKEVFSGLPHTYSYLEAESPGQVQLHMMSLSPEDVILRDARLPLREVPAYGINGGFFYGEDLLSIAIMNDVPVSGKKKAYGSGWYNAKYPRGTLVWDGAARKFSVQVVSSGDELSVSDRDNYWAQGGISMNLTDNELWSAAATGEHLPFADDKRMRSGMVYDNSGKLWLIVTPTLCTAAEFRTSIQYSVPGQGLEGIFLDGDGSSQMNAEEAVLPGDSRPVVQMIAVANERK